MPETAFRGPRLGSEHFPKAVQTLSVSLITRQGVEFKHYVAHPDVVHGVLFKTILLHRPVFMDILLKQFLDVIENVIVFQNFGGLVQSLKQDGGLVAVRSVVMVEFSHGGEAHSFCNCFPCVNHINQSNKNTNLKKGVAACNHNPPCDCSNKVMLTGEVRWPRHKLCPALPMQVRRSCRTALRMPSSWPR